MSYHKRLIFASAAEAHSKNLHRFNDLWRVWKQEATTPLPVLDDFKTTIFQWISDESAILVNSKDGWEKKHIGTSFMMGYFAETHSLAAQDMPEREVNSIHEICEEAIRRGETTYVLSPVEHQENYFFVEKLACPFQTEDGHPAVICVMAQLFSYEASVDRALNSVSEGVAYLFPMRADNGQIADLMVGYVNARAASSAGKLPSEIIGQSILTFYPNLTSAGIYQNLIKVVESNQPYSTTIKYAFDGFNNWLRIKALPLAPGCMVTLTDVTLDKAREESLNETHSALQKQHEAYRALVDANPDLICRYRPDGTILFVNQSFADAQGKRRSNLINTSLYDLIEPDKHVEAREHIDMLCRSEGVVEYERSMPVANNGVRHMRWSELVLRDAEGKVEEIQAIGRDISSLHARQEALRRLNSLSTTSGLSPEMQLEEVLKIGVNFFQMDNGVITRLEEDGKMLEVLHSFGSGVFEKGQRRNVEKTFCQYLFALGSGVHVANRDEAASLGIEDDCSPGFEAFIGAPFFLNGEIYGSINFKSTSDWQKKPNEDDLAFVRLLASFVAMTIERKLNDDRIKTSYEHYRTLFREAPVMMHSLDSDGRIATVSSTWLKELGYKAHEVLGTELQNYLKETVSSEDFKKSGSPGENSSFWAGKTYNWVRKDGSTFQGEVSDIYIDDPLTGSILSLWVIIDVSARNIAMAEVQDKNTALLEANERLKAFAYIASHDLQEPLRKMRAFSGHLRTELKEVMTDEAEFCLDAIERASQRLSNLISDLLTYSRESNKEHNLQTVDLDIVLENIFQDLSLQIKEAEMEVTKNGTLGKVLADQSAVQHLLQNLVHNAIKYRDYNKIAKLEVIRNETPNEIRLCFADNGIGFDAKWADKILQPFQRLHGKSDRPGSGIGLAVCKTVAERHGWQLVVESMPGEGSTFSIHIPK